MSSSPLTVAVTTSAGAADALQAVAEAFGSCGRAVAASGSTVTVSGPAPGPFGPFLASTTTVTLERFGAGYLLHARSDFQPSGLYWTRAVLFLVIGLVMLFVFPPLVVLAFSGFLLPALFRPSQRAKVHEDVERRLRQAAARLSLT